MGGTISIGKSINDVPNHGKEVTIEFLHKHWSSNIESFQVEPLLAETRKGVFKEDGGGASGPSIVRLRLVWKDGKFNEKQPESAVLKTESNVKLRKSPFTTRLWLASNKDYPIERQAKEWAFYSTNYKDCVANGYKMPKTYCAVRSHNKIKIPGSKAIVFFDRRVNFKTCNVMEDILHHKSPPQQSNLTMWKSKAALENMSKLHATWWYKTDEFFSTKGVQNKECVWLQNTILGVNTKTTFNKPALKFHEDKALKKAIDHFVGPLAVSKLLFP